jgi:hypothetical protein
VRRHTLIVLGIGLLVGAVGVVAAAGIARGEAVRRDRKKYQGVWRVASLEADGNRAADQDAEKITVVNQADGLAGDSGRSPQGRH